MLFGEKLRLERTKMKLSQEELAEKLGVTRRTIINYETKNMYPSGEIIGKLADIFSVSADYLLGDEDHFVIKAGSLYGTRGKKQAENLLTAAAAMFAGGDLSDEDKMAFVNQIGELYLDSKKRAKKYTSKSKNI